MAQVTRTAATNPASAAHGAHRPVTNIRGVANAEGSAVEGTDSGVGITNQNSFFQYEDFSENGSNRRGGGHHTTPHHLARVETSSETFVSMLDGTMEAEARGRIEVRGSRGFAGLLTRAIRTYETNAQVIHGENKTRGENMSFVL